MSQTETLGGGLLDQIQSLVSDHLQLVSYKWLSRNFLLPSNAAKRLLHEFVEKHGSDLDIVYSLSGWLKKNSLCYHTQLVSGHKLAEAKEQFDGNCSVQVYSVQASIPKDPAALWNTEFIQAEELFKQPSNVDNCLRDNRFCGISNHFVKRNFEGAAANIAASQPQSAGTSGSSKTIFTVPPPQQNKPPSVAIADVKRENNSSEINGRSTKPQAEKEVARPLPPDGKKSKNDKSSSGGGGGSLANMWGRASEKSKPSCAPAEKNKSVCAEAQIRAPEELDVSNSDDEQKVSFKRASNGDGGRKRRMVLDYSDEEEDYEKAVNLASPDPPKEKSRSDIKQGTETLAVEKIHLNFADKKENDTMVKEEKETKIEANQPPNENPSVIKDKNGEVESEKIQRPKIENDVKQNVNVAPNSPKRRKVIKTRIDERGREVTEVVWEGEETDVKKDEHSSTKKADNNGAANIVNRPPVSKKSPAIRNTAPSNATGKGGNKKGGNKDPKQGNILSFFKRV
ncbi:hypothetical protein ACFE04_006361 [Oxalis oulophora]